MDDPDGVYRDIAVIIQFFAISYLGLMALAILMNGGLS